MSILSHEPSHDGGNSGPGWPFGGLPKLPPTGAEIELGLDQAHDGPGAQEDVNAFLAMCANWLRGRGVPVAPVEGTYSGTAAAADFLRALDVHPVHGPIRRRS